MKEIITKTERITDDGSGIICCYAFKVIMQLEDARENIEAIHTLVGKNAPVPVFVDITESLGASKEARAYLASEDVAIVQSACAMLVNTSLSRLIGQFFLGLNKTKFPVKLFQDEAKAKQWLKTFYGGKE